MSSIWISIIPSIFLLVSEILPFIPVKYNGIAEFIYEIAKTVAEKKGIILDQKNVPETEEKISVPL